MISCSNISEPHSKHDVGPPVISPDIFNVPNGVHNAKLHMPVRFLIKIGHEVKKNWEKMANDKISQKNFN